MECQSKRLSIEDHRTVQYLTCGVRPFWLSTLIEGFDPYTSGPLLYQTDPSRTFLALKANATGRNLNYTRGLLEKLQRTLWIENYEVLLVTILK